tara:strand:- start:1063 stop:1992 length:930 start_codon:yes stop_codon:yes gene_type:complete
MLLRNIKSNLMKEEFYKYIQNLQLSITKQLEKIDGKSKFSNIKWERVGGGGGLTKIIENGDVFEKGGVNISNVFGELPKTMKNYLKTKYSLFSACGLSLVIHPKSPLIPTVHSNLRYFELYNKSKMIVDQWFGGGIDLTPYYIDNFDINHFHKVCKISCDKHDKNYYDVFKKNCDKYFWNKHREEARGVGGIFFDYLKPNGKSVDELYNFVTTVGNNFLNSYLPIVNKNKKLNYSDKQKKWQEVRRGRYVEFNLLHDKGTQFGIKTNGRIESIFMSLPPTVRWEYNFKPKENSSESELVGILKEPKEWI